MVHTIISNINEIVMTVKLSLMQLASIAFTDIAPEAIKVLYYL